VSTDQIRERLKNQGVGFTQAVAELQLKRAGVKLSPEWNRKRDVTTAAMQEARHGPLPSFDTVEALMADLEEEEFVP
jgi:hypothetical protein